MKQPYRLMTALLAALSVSVGSGRAQTASIGSQPAPATQKQVRTRKVERKRPGRNSFESATERELNELRDQISAQQAQIDQLKAQLSNANQQVTQSQQSVAEAQSQIASATAATAQAAEVSTQNAHQVQQLQASVRDLSTQNSNLQQTLVQNQQKVQQEIDSPAAFHYKGITIQPVAFFAFEGVWRQHSVNSDINTPLNNIPFPSANEGHVSELNFSGRQSRLGAFFSGAAGNLRLSGYWESDFLGTGTSSNNNQSNSYVMRQRQIWGQAATAGGFTVTGGQMWSLVAEDRRGTDNRTEIQPQTIDPQYVVGYSWERQPSIRVQQRWGDYNHGAFTLAFALEQAQITNFTASGTIPSDFFFAGPGQNGGLYNAAGNVGAGNTAGTGAISTYANNVAPDMIVKGAADWPRAHVEFGGLARFMRDFYYPVAAYTGNASAPTYGYSPNETSSTSNAGGAFGSIRVYPAKKIEVAFQAMAGTGVGRYGSAQLADATLKPNETLEPIRNYHGLFSLETHPTPKLDVFAYYGGEYDQRTVYITPQGALIGYGPMNLNDSGCYSLPPASGNSSGSAGSISASNCASPTRYIQEPMFGFVYRVVNSPQFGRLQYSATYSYLQRNLWSGNPGTSGFPSGPRAQDPMVHVSMRYYIP